MASGAGWRSVTDDPNAPAVQRSRREALAALRSATLVDNRAEYLARLATGRKVLDVGVVAHTPEAYQDPSWLHRLIAAAAASCLGCDVLPEQVEVLRSLGFNVVCHDVTTAPLNQVFDMIIAGEVIEHLDRPGPFFESCAKMLARDGKLVLTTPNPFFVTYALKGLLRGQPLVDSVDHVAWYDPATLYELGGRKGFRLERFTGVRVTETPTARARVIFGALRLLQGLVLRPEALAQTIIYEFARVA